MDELMFDRDLAARPDVAEQVAPTIRRIVAANPGPFTFTGTCTYIVGRGRVAVIDPGPDDAAHRAALLAALAGETVTHVVVTHTHRDHAPGARPLADATGARVVGCAPYWPRPGAGSLAVSDAANDPAYRPDHAMADGETLEGDGWRLRAVATPGHAANHLAFLHEEEAALFSGDHVMAWSTSIVAPPDGSMRDYMASLEKVRALDVARFWPGHGGPVTEPQRFVRGLITHRRQREAAILAQVRSGTARIGEMVPLLYAGVAPALHPAAALSVLAHLEDLTERGLVVTDGAARLDGQYRPGRAPG